MRLVRIAGFIGQRGPRRLGLQFLAVHRVADPADPSVVLGVEPGQLAEAALEVAQRQAGRVGQLLDRHGSAQGPQPGRLVCDRIGAALAGIEREQPAVDRLGHCRPVAGGPQLVQKPRGQLDRHETVDQLHRIDAEQPAGRSRLEAGRKGPQPARNFHVVAVVGQRPEQAGPWRFEMRAGFQVIEPVPTFEHDLDETVRPGRNDPPHHLSAILDLAADIADQASVKRRTAAIDQGNLHPNSPKRDRLLNPVVITCP